MLKDQKEGPNEDERPEGGTRRGERTIGGGGRAGSAGRKRSEEDEDVVLGPIFGFHL